MKKPMSFLAIILMTVCVFAQSPQKMSYQCVVRNSKGNLVANQNVGIKISILEGSSNGSVVYQETYEPNPQTNANGLVSVEIGNGVAITGNFSDINWAAGPYFLKTETDPTGRTNYTISGTSQLLSVPYALYAKTAENGFSGNYSDLSNKPILFSGNYNDLTNLPTLFDGNWISITGKPTTIAGYGITDAMNTSHPANIITSTLIDNWNVAYSWGNHVGLYRPISYVPAWSEITSKPTTVAGYGITNAVTTTDNQIIEGIKTLSNDLLINGLTVGRGTSAISTNTAVGVQALYANTTGIANTANGSRALYTNTTGYFNTANGYRALYSNTTGERNTANGHETLTNNTTGSRNTANGAGALYSNTTGSSNTADGHYTLYSNTTGYENTANGRFALFSNTTGYYNTAIGERAGYANTTGDHNTIIGYYADMGSDNLTNATAIGYRAIVTASNKVRIGNSDVTVIEGQVNWSVGSDSRLKVNIQYSDKLGLEFVNKLKTVTFTYKNDSTKMHHDGLIAQDVKKVLEQLGISFSGLIESDNEEKTMNLAYAEFVIPLINAVKELSNQNHEQQKQIDELKQLVNELTKR